MCSELHIRQILATEVSRHARTAIREADRLRRIMFAAREMNRLPKQIDDGLMAIHERRPFPLGSEAIEELTKAIKDPSYRILVSDEGLHIFNRSGHHKGEDPFSLFPLLGVEDDGGHAFYLGVELARAQIAFQLGKRYTQDQPLQWGAMADPLEDDDIDPHIYKAAGSTLKPLSLAEGKQKAGGELEEKT
jgi:hypothetical protein